jgi:Short-chain alcohol dehydrogenase of unknown specificity
MSRNYEKTVWITGGTSGYGKAMAKLFHEDGYRVVIAARNQEELKIVSKEIGCDMFCMDVTKPEDWKRAVEFAQKEFGGLDILINNAGGGVAIRDTVTLTDAEIEKTLKLNLESVMIGCRDFAKIMKAQQYGTIINVASVCARHCWPQWAAYSAAKWGVLGFSKCLYEELQPDHIRVSCAIPATCNTNFSSAAGIQQENDMLMQAEDFAKAVLEVCKLPQHVVVEDITVWGMDQVVNPL